MLVTRHGGSHGAASVELATHAGSASAHDFKPVSATVRFAAGETGARLVEIPMREDAAAESPETFTVTLGHAHCGALGTRHHATVTINDDDVLPPPPPARFTLGGTVSGLQGSGLVLTNFGTDLPVSADGAFTFPGDRPAGTTYDIEVRTQPHSPDQVCSVQHGTGTVSANVTDVVVHCDTQSLVGGLDPTFGSLGRVSTPVGGGHGEAVVIQPDDGIVTAGWRTTSAGVDFALTRHDAAGNLDHNFGSGGIATTDLGGDDDEAYDAAALPGGGIVAVGRTDAAGFTKLDFGVVRLPRRRHAGPRLRHRAGSSRPTSSAAAIRPTPSPSSPTARSWSPGPRSATASTATSRSSATTPTGRPTRASAPAASSPPISARRATPRARS